MVCSWFYSEKKESKEVALADFVRRVADGMSCFFSCFRVKDSHLVPPLKPVASSSTNALSSLFLCDDESVGKGDKRPEELDFRELKDEAKFLKACGTLPETPAEIRKHTEKWVGISSKFNMEKSSYESPTPVKISENSASGAGSLYETPISCMTDGDNIRRDSISSIISSDMKNVITSADVCDSGTRSATSSISQGSDPCGKPTRIRSQYVYCVQNPVENNSEWKEPNAAILDYDHLIESPNLNDEAILTSTMAIKDVSAGKNKKRVANPSTEQCSDEKQFGSVFGENLVYGRTPGDRPILGMVAAHWKDDESSHLPTVWDGNGIPNSTNKYKEDQKVSWHATPFEERLEKALSEGTFVSHRKPIIGTPLVEFDETEEADTALSHLQSPAHLKSVVSF